MKINYKDCGDYFECHVPKDMFDIEEHHCYMYGIESKDGVILIPCDADFINTMNAAEKLYEKHKALFNKLED